MEVQASKEKKESAPKVELKSLPSHLKDEFLGRDSTFPVIVNVKLGSAQLEKLLDILTKHRCVIGYSINDIKEISPSL